MRLKPPYEVEHDENDTYVALPGTDYAVARVLGKDPVDRKEDAAFIVRACNSHDELVAKLAAVVAYYDYAEFGPVAEARALLSRLEAK